MGQVLDCGQSTDFSLGHPSPRRPRTDPALFSDSSDRAGARVSGIYDGMYQLSGTLHRVLERVLAVNSGIAQKLASQEAQRELLHQSEWKSPEALLSHSEGLLHILRNQAGLIEESMGGLLGEGGTAGPVEKQAFRLVEESETTLRCLRAISSNTSKDGFERVLTVDSALHHLHLLEILKREELQAHQAIIQVLASKDSIRDRSPIAPSSEDWSQATSAHGKKGEVREESGWESEQKDVLRWLSSTEAQVDEIGALFHHQGDTDDTVVAGKGTVSTAKKVAEKIADLQSIAAKEIHETDDLLNSLLNLLTNLSLRVPDAGTVFVPTSQRLIVRSSQQEGKVKLMCEKAVWMVRLVTEVSAWVEGKMNVLELYHSRIARLSRSMSDAPYK